MLQKKGGLVCLLLLGVFDRSCYVSFHKDYDYHYDYLSEVGRVPKSARQNSKQPHLKFIYI